MYKLHVDEGMLTSFFIRYHFRFSIPLIQPTNYYYALSEYLICNKIHTTPVIEFFSKLLTVSLKRR
jgi:hypothetical protein